MALTNLWKRIHGKRLAQGSEFMMELAKPGLLAYASSAWRLDIIIVEIGVSFSDRDYLWPAERPLPLLWHQCPCRLLSSDVMQHGAPLGKTWVMVQAAATHTCGWTASRGSRSSLTRQTAGR